MIKLTNISFPKSLILVLFTLILPLSGCGGSGGNDKATPSSDSSTTPVIASPASIKLSASPISVKSDDSSTSTITATVLDASNAAIKGLTVTFSTTGGKLSAASAVSDANGKAQITFSSGTLDQTNKVVMITGTASGLSSQIPVSITGSKIDLSTNNTNLIAGSGTATLTIVAKDASGTPVYNVPVTLATDIAGVVTLSRTSGNTDTEGKLTATVTASGAGSATVTVQGLGYTATQAYTVTPIGTTFRITSPSINPVSMATNTNLTITVNASGAANVTFATTLGTWDGGVLSIVTKPVVAGVASAVISSTLAGNATVQVYDAANIATTSSVDVVFSAAVGEAANITLQSDKSVVGLSTVEAKKTAVLVATVTTAAYQPVSAAPVQFSIIDPTGGGETVSPVIVYTDTTGVAKATFTSGSRSSFAPGVSLKAAVVGTAINAIKKIIIGGTAGSVVIGYGTEITVLSTTTYQLPMAVLVADSSGAPVPGAVVSLSAWPSQYSAGVWYDSDPDPKLDKFVLYVVTNQKNEDINENMILDPGEDLNFNGILDPPNSAAGDVPATVITDENGVANFNLTFLKNYSGFIVTRVRASTMVLGTETTSSITFRLPAEKATAEAGNQPDSIFNIDLVVGSAAGSQISYTMPTFVSTNAVFSAVSGTFPAPTVPPAPPASPTYTFTNAAGAPIGTVFYDAISITDPSGVSTRSPIPVRIVVR